MKLLSAFSAEIDGVIDFVRSKLIQIRGPANDNQGLFDFEYTDEQVSELFARSLVGANYEDFLKLIFEELWRRTGANLVKVVHYIRNDLTRRLTALLDRLTQDMSGLDPGIAHSPFGDALLRCRTQIQNELESIASWFGPSSAEAVDSYDMQVLLDSAVATARKCFPTYGFDPRIELSENVRCRGVTLAPMEDIFFILFSNIVKHSGLPVVDAEVVVLCDGGNLVLRVTNSIAAHLDLTRIAAEVDRIGRISWTSGAVAQLRAEGGTGYHKLHKLLRFDLGQHDYSVSVRLLERQFQVEVRFPRAAVAAPQLVEVKKL